MSQFKKKITAFTAMLAFLSLSSAASFAVSTGDVLGNTGNVGFGPDGNKFDIDINSGINGDVGQVDWKDFSVGANQNVNFGFSGLSQTIINRVLGGKTSDIQGKLTNSCIAGGSCDSYADTNKVILINPAGVVFGAGSMVDLNSFTVSTFDFNGAKNIKDMTPEQLSAYQSSILNKMSPDPNINGENRYNGYINFDSNYTKAFEDAGVKFNKGGTFINVQGSKFGHFNPDGSDNPANPNKSLIFISDNIKYKDSMIKTGGNNNYMTNQGDQSLSRVRFITADGVTFKYAGNGYANNYEVAEDTKSNVVRNIDIDNSGLANDEAAIRAGSVHIVNKSNADGSNIKISNSIIRGTKLVNHENGDIYISGSKDVLVDHSRLDSVNTHFTNRQGNVVNTENQKGGEIYVSGANNVKIKDSLLMSAGAKNQPADSNAGAVRIISTKGNANVDNSKVLAKGELLVGANQKANISNSLMEAEDTLEPGSKNNITVDASGGVNIHNTVGSATGNIDIQSTYSNQNLSGDINITSDLDRNGKNQTLLIAGDKLSIQGKNTKLDNASVAYKDIKFYNDRTQGKNNVTVANNSTFSHIVDGKVSKDVNLETNGNFNLDNATVKRAAYKLSYKETPEGKLYDDGTIDAVEYSYSTTTADNGNLEIRSTGGDVNSYNKTNVHTTNNTKLVADNGNVNISDSAFKADNDLTALSVKKSVNIKNDSTMQAGNDVNVDAYDTITFGKKGASGVNIDDSSKISAGHNINVKSRNGDINAEKTTMPTLAYGNRLVFNAKNNNNITSENSLKSVNVDYIAGNENNITTNDDVQFVNSSMKAPKNNITTRREGGDVIMNNLKINQATPEAKDTVTKINAKGNVTTKDVTKTAKDDVNAPVHYYPQDVRYNPSGVAHDGVLDVNQTKLIVNTKVNAKTPKNDSNGSINLDVKNANNKLAGLELTAENHKWDEQIGPNEGPEVHLNAVDNDLSVSKIVTDKLWLDKNDRMYAADVQLTPDQLAKLPAGTASKGYIEVRDQGGFNMDDNGNGYNPNPDGFSYDKHFDTQIVDKDVQTDTKVTEGNEYIKDTQVDTKVDVEWQKDPDQKVTTTTTTTTTTHAKDTTSQDTVTTTTTTTDKRHTITFDNNNPAGGDFILVYDKTNTKTETEVKDPVVSTETWQTVDKDVKVDIDKCEEPPHIDQTDDNIDSLINQIKLPREQVEISKTSKVADNTVDQTTNIMSAAAKIDLAEETTQNTKEEKEDKE